MPASNTILWRNAGSGVIAFCGSGRCPNSLSNRCTRSGPSRRANPSLGRRSRSPSVLIPNRFSARCLLASVTSVCAGNSRMAAWICSLAVMHSDFPVRAHSIALAGVGITLTQGDSASEVIHARICSRSCATPPNKRVLPAISSSRLFSTILTAGVQLPASRARCWRRSLSAAISRDKACSAGFRACAAVSVIPACMPLLWAE